MVMTDDRAHNDTSRFDVRPTVETHFSWLRTRMSTERTLMSWVRTATALIGFGFTIVQIFERFSTTEGVAPAMFPQAPRYLGLALIGAGTLALIIAAWEYRGLIRYLWRTEFTPVAGIGDGPGHTPILGVMIVLILIGLFALRCSCASHSVERRAC
jgi:putative membrane protein